tara:strand:+ start:8393 stop:8575 length:183 start_codon:yes stop_codon:yes gene_type:complete
MPGHTKSKMTKEQKEKKDFKPHMMYCKDGKAHRAATYKAHLDLKKKGCGHSKPKMYDKNK